MKTKITYIALMTFIVGGMSISLAQAQQSELSSKPHPIPPSKVRECLEKTKDHVYLEIARCELRKKKDEEKRHECYVKIAQHAQKTYIKCSKIEED